MKTYLKRALSLLITLVMVISLIPAGVMAPVAEAATASSSAAITPDYSWYSAGATSYEIKDAAQLLAFDRLMQGAVSGVTTAAVDFTGKTVTLTADIDLNPGLTAADMKKSTPANVWYGRGKFHGTFNGNGKTVSGIYLVTSQRKAGFLGRVYATDEVNVTVQNLTITNSYYSFYGSPAQAEPQEQVGILFGDIDTIGHAAISGITVENTVVEAYNVQKFLGLIGRKYNKTGTITVSGCTLASTVSMIGTDAVGGMIGYVQQGTATIKDCIVAATVRGTKNVGAMIGRLGDNVNITFEGTCKNTGKITAMISGVGSDIGTVKSTGNNKITGSVTVGSEVAANKWTGGNITWDTTTKITSAVKTSAFTTTATADKMDFSWFEPGYDATNKTIKYVDASATNNKTLEINTAAQYVAFIQMRIAGTIDSSASTTTTSFAGYTIRLTKDINLNGASFNAINSHACFEGTFDGQGHSISNFTSNGTGGLRSVFGSVGRGAVFKNLIFNGTVDFTASETDHRNGRAIIARVITDQDEHENRLTTKISNVISVITLEDNNTTYTINSSGGIIGRVEGNGNCEITDCIFAGTVSAPEAHEIGGIVGKIEGTPNVTFNGCVNQADITGTSNVGGIVGYVSLTSGNKIRFIGCVNRGNITATTNYAAGMMGFNEVGAIYSLTNCENFGTVTATKKGSFTSEPDDIEMIGMQSRKNENETTDYRFVAAVRNYSNSSGFGFKFKISYLYMNGTEAIETFYCTKGYRSVLNDNETITAESKNADFFITLTVRSVPNSVAEVNFEVTPFKAESAETRVLDAKSSYSVNSVLKGIKIGAVGDSYLDRDAYGYVWPEKLAKYYGGTYYDWATAGSTVSNKHTDKVKELVTRCIYRETDNANKTYGTYVMKDDQIPDIVMIEGGRNDFNHHTPIIDSTKETELTIDGSKYKATFGGALNLIIKEAKQQYPDAMIVLVTPWNFTGTNDLGYTYKEYVNAMITLAELHDVYLINASKPATVGVDMTSSAFKKEYTENGNSVSHLNEKGMDYVMPRFAKILAGYYREFKSKTDASLTPPAQTQKQQVSVMSYNIWGGYPTGYSVGNRDQLVSDIVHEYLPDVLGMQEYSQELYDLKLENKLLDEYTMVDVSAAVTKAGATINQTPLFYRRSTVKLIKSGYHLFDEKWSGTVNGTAYTDQQANNSKSKSVTWGVFETLDGTRFSVFNTHYWWKDSSVGDGLADAIRQKNARDIMNIVSQQGLSSHPVIIMGDMNSYVGSGAYNVLANGGYTDAQAVAKESDNSGTHHKYPTLNTTTNTYTGGPAPTGTYLASSLDHIFISNAYKNKVEIFDIITTQDALNSSDHCPVYAKFDFS